MFSIPPTCREDSGHSRLWVVRWCYKAGWGRDTVGRTCYSCITDDKGSDESRGGRQRNEISQKGLWDSGSECI